VDIFFYVALLSVVLVFKFHSMARTHTGAQSTSTMHCLRLSCNSIVVALARRRYQQVLNTRFIGVARNATSGPETNKTRNHVTSAAWVAAWSQIVRFPCANDNTLVGTIDNVGRLYSDPPHHHNAAIFVRLARDWCCLPCADTSRWRQVCLETLSRLDSREGCSSIRDSPPLPCAAILAWY